MKKLNRKGFTFIELLAIIVILAIIMVVTIPTVLNSLDNAKIGQLENAANSVAEWLEKQYSLNELGSISGGASPAYTTWSGYNIGSAAIKTGVNGTALAAKTLTSEVLSAAGIADASTSIEVGSTATATIGGVAGVTYVKTVNMSAGSGATFQTAKDTSNTVVSSAYYNSTTGRMCVELVAKNGGSFFVKSDTREKHHAKSSGC